MDQRDIDLLILSELMSDDDEDPVMEVLQDAEYHELQDWEDGTGRWDRTGTPHDKRWWHKEAHKLPSKSFSALFRLRKTTFRSLVYEVCGTTDYFRAERRGRYIDPCKRVAVVLFRVGCAQGVRQTAAKFNIAEGSVVSWTMSVATRVVDRLRIRYVRWPSPREQRDIMRSWEHEKALRKVIGGIDGSHIKIPGPDEDLLLAYYNYKKFYSIVLLAVVDNVGRFRWFCSGCPGSCGDSGVLQATAFYKLAQEELSKPVEERKIFADGSCILGDSAFAEGPWMRTPISLPQERAERFFNCKHSSMRMRVEHAFGRLKWKFLAMQRGLLFKLEHSPIIIDACVILYNFILDHEGTWSSHVHIDDAQTRGGTGRAHGETSVGREAQVAYLRDGGFLQEEWGNPGSRADTRRVDRERRFRGQEEVPPVDL